MLEDQERFHRDLCKEAARTCIGQSTLVRQTETAYITRPQEFEHICTHTHSHSGASPPYPSQTLEERERRSTPPIKTGSGKFLIRGACPQQAQRELSNSSSNLHKRKAHIHFRSFTSEWEMLLNHLNRDMSKPFRSHGGWFG